MSITNYGEVHLFHRKMGLAHPKIPQLLDEDDRRRRVRFMLEELNEFIKACEENDLPNAADALIDLVYVVMGTGVMMGLPWQALWDAVQYANIRKERVLDDGSHHFGVMKPVGWEPPNLKTILDRYTDLTLAEADPRSSTFTTKERVEDRCASCGLPYDQHDGTEEHRYK